MDFVSISFLFVRQWLIPPDSTGEIESFSKNKNGEVMQAEGIDEKITSKCNRNGLAAALLKYRRLKA